MITLMLNYKSSILKEMEEGHDLQSVRTEGVYSSYKTHSTAQSWLGLQGRKWQHTLNVNCVYAFSQPFSSEPLPGDTLAYIQKEHMPECSMSHSL
jgi:hypothetical protein